MSSLLNDPLLQSVPVVNGYKVLEPCVLYAKLGEGGMGAVYRGRHLNLNVDVAVKCMTSAILSGDAVARFQREAMVAAKINHPNLIRVYDVRESDQGVHYIVMEFVEGETARGRVERKGPLDPAEACAITLAAARGLSAAHSLEVIHRDIKPENVLLSCEGEVKLADLGLAKSSEGLDSLMTGTNVTMGTPQYMPPEQYEGAAKVGPPGDVYALGATLWFLLAGHDAITGESLPEIMKTVCDGGIPDIRAIRPGLPESLAAVIDRAVRRDAGERYPDVQEMAGKLEACQAELGAVPDLGDMQAGSKGHESSPPTRQEIESLKSNLTAGSIPQTLAPGAPPATLVQAREPGAGKAKRPWALIAAASIVVLGGGFAVWKLGLGANGSEVVAQGPGTSEIEAGVQPRIEEPASPGPASPDPKPGPPNDSPEEDLEDSKPSDVAGEEEKNEEEKNDPEETENAPSGEEQAQPANEPSTEDLAEVDTRRPKVEILAEARSALRQEDWDGCIGALAELLEWTAEEPDSLSEIDRVLLELRSKVATQGANLNEALAEYSENDLLELAEAGSVQAMLAVAQLHFWYEVTLFKQEEDDEAPFKWLSSAAEKGDQEAHYHLGGYFQARSEIESAYVHFERAYGLGHEEAGARMASVLLDFKTYPSPVASLDDDERSDKGLELTRNAANRGSGQACFMMGNFYMNGEHGFPKDKDAAEEYYVKAANLGQILAIGQCAISDYEVADWKKCRRAARRAANAGSRGGTMLGSFIYGVILDRGYGGDGPDIETANRYYAIAAGQGFPRAQEICKQRGIEWSE